MGDEDVKKTAVEITVEALKASGVGVNRVLLFGSRARGDHDKDSDWDFLVVTDRKLNFGDKAEIVMHIKRKLAKLGIPNDVIVTDEATFERMKDCVGSVSSYAAREGVRIW